jgi:hypothetical protein
MEPTAHPPIVLAIRAVRPVPTLELAAGEERTYRYIPTRDGMPLKPAGLRALASAIKTGDIVCPGSVEPEALLDWMKAYMADCAKEA